MNEWHQHPVWHPFTQMRTAAPPLEISHARNSSLYTTDGRVLIDGIASWWVNVHGHAHPDIAAAISHQAQTLEQVIFAGFTHQPALQLATGLLHLFGGHYNKVFYSDDGSTSVEVALKMAMQYWNNQGIKHKRTILALEGAYHGDTFGGMSIAARNGFNEAFNDYLFDVVHLPVPTDTTSLQKALEVLRDAGKDDAGALFIFEPLVQGAAGMIMYPPEHLDLLMQEARNLNILCIADEVMTGFGRTGKLFATDYLKHRADIICLSKGITGGFLPLGATLCTSAIYEAFHSTESRHTFYHGHSYTANPIACAAAVASLKLLTDESCTRQRNSISELHHQFASTIQQHPAVREVRQLGTILAIELESDEPTSYFNTAGKSINQFFLERSIYLRPLGNVVYVMPPYCITEMELKQIYTAIEELLQSKTAAS